jgi:hypothetical protein
VQEVAGELGEEVGQKVVGGMGSGSEAQAEHAWRRRLGAQPGLVLLCDPQVPAGRPTNRLLVCDGRQRLWEGGGVDNRGTTFPSLMVPFTQPPASPFGM